MNFTVLLSPSAERHMSAAWLDSPDRAAFLRAGHALNRRLSRDPLNDGESLTKGRRVAIENPLTFFYEVDTIARVVRVLRVVLHRTGPRA